MGQNWRAANAEREMNDPDSVLSFYKKVIAYQKNNPLIRDGSFHLLWPEHEKIFAYKRTLGSQKLLVLCNFSAENVALPDNLNYTESDIELSNYTSSNPANLLRPFESLAVLCCSSESLIK